MQSVELIARDIVRREGGFVHDPGDPGGATKYGVTIHTLKALRRDLDGDGDVDVADVKLLSEDDAVRIFIDGYYRKPGLAALPEPLQASVFDMQVNAGSTAVRLLQTVLNQSGFAPLVEDGVLGPRTAAAAGRAFAAMGTLLVDAYGIERREYYYRLADRRPASRKYARRQDGGKGGWITRAEEFISPRFHLTEAQHRTRTAIWG
ncbi:MAG TPA: holin-associated N-acetylmuramidase [Paracoccaceae bacterium]|nr:holin-associated N-acetylmuramidase [Paracoccaceae bacterium]